MSDRYGFLRSEDSRSGLFADGLILMTKGAGYALALCVGLGVLYAVTVGVGKLLPPESKEQPDPTPLSWVQPEDAPVAAV